MLYHPKLLITFKNLIIMSLSSYTSLVTQNIIEDYVEDLNAFDRHKQQFAPCLNMINRIEYKYALLEPSHINYHISWCITEPVTINGYQYQNILFDMGLWLCGTHYERFIINRYKCRKCE